VSAINAEALSRAVLLGVIPTGFRLIDRDDPRLQAVTPLVVRLAMRHLGPKPCLIAFTGPEQDSRAAAHAAVAYAAQNFVPTAIQRSVSPGVLVVAVTREPQPPSRWTAPGTRVMAAIWTVEQQSGRVRAAGRPPGAPAGGLPPRAAAALARGVEAPPIGRLDVAERELMVGRRRVRGPVISGGGAVLLVILLLLFGPRLLGAALAFSAGRGYPAL
jgi:hypothetical protein